MGHQAKSKWARHQIRQVAQEQLPEVMKIETMIDIGKRCSDLTMKRMDEVAKDAASDLKKLGEETQTFRAYAIRELRMQLDNELFNTNCTVIAMMNVLYKRLGIAEEDFEALGKDIETEKEVVREKLMADAREKEAERRAEEKLAKQRDAEQKELEKAKATKDIVTEVNDQDITPETPAQG